MLRDLDSKMTQPAFVGVPVGAGAFTTRSISSTTHIRTTRARTPRRRRAYEATPPQMGLFGLGLPEVAVIVGVGVFLFGPGKIADMGKDLGGMAGSVKKATSEFQEAMEESLKEADAEISKRKQEKENASNKTVDATATVVEGTTTESK